MRYAISVIKQIILHTFMNQDGDTALSRAARKKNAGMVTLLLDRGATIDHTDKVERLPVRYKLWGICF